MEKVVIIDLGGNISRISRIIRKMNVYCDIISYTDSIEGIENGGYSGIIIAGSALPLNVDTESARGIFECGLPVLAICSGAVLMAKLLGADIEECAPREESVQAVIDSSSRLFAGVSVKSSCLLGYAEAIEQVPVDFKITAKAEGCHVAAMECAAKRLYAVQFVPDNILTEGGLKIISNFLFNICGCIGEWTASFLTKSTIRRIKSEFEGKKVICVLSGDMKSTLGAVLMHRAIGSRLICIMPDIGGMRSEILGITEHYLTESEEIRVVREDFKHRIIGQLVGVNEAGQKKSTIARELVRIITEQVKKLAGADFLLGVDSFLETSADHIINTAADFLGISVARPLESFNEDDIVRAAREIGIPEELINASALPREGLGSFISGAITDDKLSAIALADGIFTDELIKSGRAGGLSRFFVQLSSIGAIEGLNNTAGYCITLCAVYGGKGISRLPYDLLETVACRIINEIPSVVRVLYDITP